MLSEFSIFFSNFPIFRFIPIFIPILFHVHHKSIHFTAHFTQILNTPQTPTFSLRLPKIPLRKPGPHKPDPAPSSRTSLVHVASSLLNDGRYPTVRRRFHRTLFHFHRYLGESVLLPVRILVFSVRYFDHCLQSNLDCYGLLSIVRRRLSLVVEKLFCQWRKRVLRVFV